MCLKMWYLRRVFLIFQKKKKTCHSVINGMSMAKKKFDVQKIYKNPLYRFTVVASWLYAIVATFKGSLPAYTYITATLVAAGLLGESFSNANELLPSVLSYLSYYIYLPVISILEYLKYFRRYKAAK